MVSILYVGRAVEGEMPKERSRGDRGISSYLLLGRRARFYNLLLPPVVGTFWRFKSVRTRKCFALIHTHEWWYISDKAPCDNKTHQRWSSEHEAAIIPTFLQVPTIKNSPTRRPTIVHLKPAEFLQYNEPRHWVQITVACSYTLASTLTSDFETRFLWPASCS